SSTSAACPSSPATGRHLGETFSNARPPPVTPCGCNVCTAIHVVTSKRAVAAALEILGAVARQDPDRAQLANDRGFSKADARLGHRLAAMHPETRSEERRVGKARTCRAGRWARAS